MRPTRRVVFKGLPGTLLAGLFASVGALTIDKRGIAGPGGSILPVRIGGMAGIPVAELST